MGRKQIFTSAGFIVAIGLAGCGGGDSPHIGDISGVWEGSFTSNAAGTVTMTLRLNQNGDNVTGDYSVSNGVHGTISGTATTTFNATLTPVNTGCQGTATGTGVVSSECLGLVCVNQMNFTYTGTFSGESSCAGVETGTGTLFKQVVIPF